MKAMRKTRIIAICIAVVVCWPIGFYLQYKILQSVKSTELMWFLFWVNIPFSLIVQILARVTAQDE